MWWWILFWAVLVVCSLAYLAWRLWLLWRQVKAFGRELAVAQARLDEVEGTLERVGAPVITTGDLAVFANPVEVAVSTARTRQASRAERDRRRAASAPLWAKHVD